MKSLFVRLGIVAGLGVVIVVVGGASLTLGCKEGLERGAAEAADVLGATAVDGTLAAGTETALAVRTGGAAEGAAEAAEVVPEVEVVGSRYDGLQTIRANPAAQELMGQLLDENVNLISIRDLRNRERLFMGSAWLVAVGTGVVVHLYDRYQFQMQLNNCREAMDAWKAALESSDAGNLVELAKQAETICTAK